MKWMELHSRMQMKSGGLRQLADITGSHAKYRMMFMSWCQISLEWISSILRMHFQTRKNICVPPIWRSLLKNIIWTFHRMEHLIQEIFLAVMMTLIMYTIHREHGIWHAAWIRVQWTGMDRMQILHHFLMISLGAWFRRKRWRSKMWNTFFLLIFREHRMIRMHLMEINPWKVHIVQLV